MCIRDRLNRQEVPTLNASGNLVFAEPLTSNLTMRINNRYEYIRDKQDVGIFDKDLASSKYELLDYAQSTGFERVQNRFTSYAAVSYTHLRAHETPEHLVCRLLLEK